MRKNKKTLSLLCVALMVGMTSCAHKSKIKPSTGHIDGQNTATSQTVAKSAGDKNTATTAIPKPVTNNTYLPPPKAKTKEQVYSIVVYDTPVKEVLFAIARDSKLNVDIHPSIQGRVTLNAVDQTLPAILERLSKQVDLTYKIQGNVLSIAPDQPVLRTYKIDYVNMSRDTTGEVGVASEIASTGSGAVGSTTGTTNSSKTSVKSTANNHFWATLIANIKDILAETDKEIIVSKFGALASTESEPTSNGKANANGDKNTTDTGKSSTEQREQQRSEYKTLYAANVIANPETGIISVRGTNKQHERVQEFIDQVMTSAKRQVLIEATIVEVQLSDEFQAGIDWSRLAKSGFIFSQALGPQIVAAGAITNGIIAPDRGIVAGYASQNGNVLASVQLLEKFGNTKVLSSPKLMVLNNQTGILKVVKNRVYFTVKSEVTPATTALSEPIVSMTATPHTVPIGIVMSVTPQITGGDMVSINVRPTISREIGTGVIDPTPSLNGKSSIPEIQVQEMESLLQISSGNTAVLGGLMQDQLKADLEAVPGLSKIKGVGKAFTGRDEATVKTELVIFLRPTVIKNASLESDELSTYKQYLPSQQLNKTIDESSER